MPEGFKLAEDSATQISEGIVIEDKQENQWVWVPCHVEGGVNQEGTVLYDRYAISSEVYTATKLSSKHSDGSFYISSGASSSYYHEGLSTTSNDYKSIKEYGGYFIGRYEAGKYDGKVVVQKDKETYTSITVAQCHSLSNGMISDSLSKVYTRLCSSYAWDTALMFIQKTHPTYGINSKTKDGVIAGQYSNNLYGTGKLNTGKTLPVCNIYDMGGNVDEFTSELRTATGSEHVLRGGRYEGQVDPVSESSGTRYGYGGGSQVNAVFGFRVTLYIKSTN